MSIKSALHFYILQPQRGGSARLFNNLYRGILYIGNWLMTHGGGVVADISFFLSLFLNESSVRFALFIIKFVILFFSFF